MLHPAVPRNPLPTPTIKSCLAHQPRALLQGPTPPSAGLMPLSGVGLGDDDMGPMCMLPCDGHDVMGHMGDDMGEEMADMMALF